MANGWSDFQVNEVGRQRLELDAKEEQTRGAHLQAFAKVCRKHAAVAEGRSLDTPTMAELEEHARTYEAWQVALRRVDECVKKNA